MLSPIYLALVISILKARACRVELGCTLYDECRVCGVGTRVAHMRPRQRPGGYGHTTPA